MGSLMVEDVGFFFLLRAVSGHFGRFAGLTDAVYKLAKAIRDARS